MNLRRLSGALMIFNTLLPIVLLLIILFTLGSIVNDIKNLISEPLSMINTSLIEIREQIDLANNTFDGVTVPAENLQQEVNRVFQTVASIPENVRIPVVDTNVAIPGLSQVKQVLRTNFQILRDLGASITGFSYIQSLNAEIQHLIQAGDRLIFGIQSIVTKLVTLVIVISAILIPWIIFSYSTWVYRRLVTGWELLKGTSRE